MPNQPDEELAPGAVLTVSRFVPVDSYAGLEPGLYGVNIQVGVNTGQISVWAGTVRLPLAASP